MLAVGPPAQAIQAKAQFDKLRGRLLDESQGVEAVIRSLRHLRQKHPRRKVEANKRAYSTPFGHPFHADSAT